MKFRLNPWQTTHSPQSPFEPGYWPRHHGPAGPGHPASLDLGHQALHWWQQKSSMGGSAANFGADVALLSTTHSRRLHKLHEIVGLIEKMVMGFNFPYFPIFSHIFYWNILSIHGEKQPVSCRCWGSAMANIPWCSGLANGPMAGGGGR